VNIKFLVVLLLAGLALPQRAHAYLDPGNISYMLQVAFATIVGALFSLKIYWQRIVGYFKGSPSSALEKK
jgi:hypothetical protein